MQTREVKKADIQHLDTNVFIPSNQYTSDLACMAYACFDNKGNGLGISIDKRHPNYGRFMDRYRKIEVPSERDIPSIIKYGGHYNNSAHKYILNIEIAIKCFQEGVMV